MSSWSLRFLRRSAVTLIAVTLVLVGVFIVASWPRKREAPQTLYARCRENLITLGANLNGHRDNAGAFPEDFEKFASTLPRSLVSCPVAIVRL